MISKTLSILFFVLTIIYCSADSSSFRILSPEVASFGHSIPILSKDRAMYVLVDFAYNGPKSYPMALSLHSSETIFMNNMLNFAEFKCELPDCSISNTDSNHFSHAYLSLSGQRVQSSVYLNHHIWYFARSDSYRPLMATKLTAGIANMGKGYSGILGMGAAKNGRHLPEVFSIYINKNGLSGNIVFGNDMRYVESSLPIATLPSDENWVVYGGTTITTTNWVVSFQRPFKVIFDINYENILLPSFCQQDLIDILKQKENGLNCADQDGFFKCSSNLKADKWPTISLEISRVLIKIPPRIYILGSDYNLNSPALSARTIFKFSSDSNKNNFVNIDFYNYIILGRNFMKEHYTVFDCSYPKIILYAVLSSNPPITPPFEDVPTPVTPLTPVTPSPTPTAPDNSQPVKSSDDTIYIVIIGILSVGLIWALFFKKSKEDKVSQEISQKLLKNQENSSGGKRNYVNPNIQYPNPFNGSGNTSGNVNSSAQSSNPLPGNGNNIQQNAQFLNKPHMNVNNTNLNAQIPHQLPANGNNLNKNIQYPNPFPSNTNLSPNTQIPPQFKGNGNNFNPNAQYPNPFPGNPNNFYKNPQFQNQLPGNINFHQNAQIPPQFRENGNNFNTNAQHPNPFPQNGNNGTINNVNQNAQLSNPSTGNKNNIKQISNPSTESSNNANQKAEEPNLSKENGHEVTNNQPTETK